jgi:hypothetical protein
MVKVTIDGKNRRILVDTGAEDSLVKQEIRSEKFKPSTSATMGVFGGAMRWEGEREICFSLNGYAYTHTFGILTLPPHIDGIFGLDFMTKRQVSINLGKGVIRLVKGAKLNRHPLEQGTSQDRRRQRGRRKKRRPEPRVANMDFSRDQ